MKKPILEPGPQIKPQPRALSNSDLDGVSGGMLQNAVSNAIKSLGDALATSARKAG